MKGPWSFGGGRPGYQTTLVISHIGDTAVSHSYKGAGEQQRTDIAPAESYHWWNIYCTVQYLALDLAVKNGLELELLKM